MFNKCFVCTDAIIEGEFDITIDSDTIVNPKTVIRALGGPIEIGSSNIFEEQVEIVNHGPGTLRIGSFNIFEVGAKCSAQLVGDMNVFEIKSEIGQHVTIGDGCVIGIRSKVDAMPGEDCNKVEDGTVVFYLSDLGYSIRRNQEMPATANEHKAIAKRYVAVLSDPESANYIGAFHHLISLDEK